MSFTNGPWKWSRNRKDWWIFDQLNHETVCNLIEHGKKTEGNALLIASAPDLLAACEAAELAFRVPAGTDPEREIAALSQLRAAIARAKGEV